MDDRHNQDKYQNTTAGGSIVVIVNVVVNAAGIASVSGRHSRLIPSQ